MWDKKQVFIVIHHTPIITKLHSFWWAYIEKLTSPITRNNNACSLWSLTPSSSDPLAPQNLVTCNESSTQYAGTSRPRSGRKFNKDTGTFYLKVYYKHYSLSLALHRGSAPSPPRQACQYTASGPVETRYLIQLSIPSLRPLPVIRTHIMFCHGAITLAYIAYTFCSLLTGSPL